jgi:Fur family ferric uptake transcriptional regulator
LRMTPQRSIILEELRKTKSHPTADEVYALVRRRLPRVSLATVYRNLDTLTRAGLIQTVELGGCPRRYDSWVDDHIHVRCLDCGRVDDITDGLLRRTRKRVEEVSGYSISGHHLEFTGRCPGCERKPRGRRRKTNAEAQGKQD